MLLLPPLLLRSVMSMRLALPGAEPRLPPCTSAEVFQLVSIESSLHTPLSDCDHYTSLHSLLRGFRYKLTLSQALQSPSEVQARDIAAAQAAIPATTSFSRRDAIDAVNLNVDGNEGVTMTFVETVEDDDEEE